MPKKIPFNDRLREAIRLRGITQSELANKTGISKSMISEYLAGKYLPKQDNIYKLAQVLVADEAWLMGLHDVNMSGLINIKEVLRRTYEKSDFDVAKLSREIVRLQGREDELNGYYEKVNMMMRSLNKDGLEKLTEYLNDLAMVGKYNIL